MAIQFPDFQLLIARTAQGPQGVKAVNAAETPAYLHAQVAAIQEQGRRRRERVSEGQKAAGSLLERRGERPAGLRRAPSRDAWDRGKGQHLDIQA